MPLQAPSHFTLRSLAVGGHQLALGGMAAAVVDFSYAARAAATRFVWFDRPESSTLSGLLLHRTRTH